MFFYTNIRKIYLNSNIYILNKEVKISVWVVLNFIENFLLSE